MRSVAAAGGQQPGASGSTPKPELVASQVPKTFMVPKWPGCSQRAELATACDEAGCVRCACFNQAVHFWTKPAHSLHSHCINGIVSMLFTYTHTTRLVQHTKDISCRRHTVK